MTSPNITSSQNGSATLSTNATKASLYFSEPGDTLGSIAQKVGITESQLRTANPDVTNPEWLLQGQAIQIPTTPCTTTHSSFSIGDAPWEASIWADTPWHEKALVTVGFGFDKLNQGLNKVSEWQDETVKTFDAIGEDPNTSEALRFAAAALKLPARIGTGLVSGAGAATSLITNPESRAQLAEGIKTLYENPQILVEAAKQFANKPAYEQVADVIVLASDLAMGGKGAAKAGRTLDSSPPHTDAHTPAKVDTSDRIDVPARIETPNLHIAIAQKMVLPKSLDEASTILMQRRDDIIANGYQPKYSDAELAYLAKHGNVGGERFQVRFMEERYLQNRDTPDTPLSGAMGGVLETETGGRGAKYWSTSFDQLEDADSDPKLIAEKLGLDYNPGGKYALIIVDTVESTPLTGVKSVPATFEKVSQFANDELPKTFPKALTDQIMTREFQAKYTEHYRAAVDGKFLENQWSKDTQDFDKYLKTTNMNPNDAALLKSRMLMHDKIGNNQDYLGNGLTKDNNPNSPNDYGVVETLNFERKEVNLKSLQDASAIQIIKGLTII